MQIKHDDISENNVMTVFYGYLDPDILLEPTSTTSLGTILKELILL